jgi:hypothetical protein
MSVFRVRPKKNTGKFWGNKFRGKKQMNKKEGRQLGTK